MNRSAQGDADDAAMAGGKSRTPSRRRLWLFRLLAAGIAIVFALAVSEAVIRVVLFKTYRGTIDRLPPGFPTDPNKKVQLSELIRPDADPDVLYRFKPGSSGNYVGAAVRINDQGLRDDPIAIPKPPRTLRVVGVGDSSMFGYGVGVYDCYLELLQAEFQRLAPPDWSVEFVNTAVVGYNTTQEAAAFLRFGLAFEPDAVLIQFDHNDLTPPAGTSKPDFLFTPHVFMAHIPSILRGAYSDAEAFNLVSQGHQTAYDYEAAWIRVETSYRQLAEACRAKDIPLLAFTNLLEDQAPPAKPSETDPTGARIAKIWQKYGIPSFDMKPAALAYLRRSGRKWNDLAVVPGDPHVNRSGHALVAQALLEPVREMLAPRFDFLNRPPEGGGVVGNRLLRGLTATGLYETEKWGGAWVNWTEEEAHFQFMPGGRTLLIPMHIGHPGLSQESPLKVYLRVDGVPTRGFPSGVIERTLKFSAKQTTTTQVALGDLAGAPLDLTIAVDRTFRAPNDWRNLGVAIDSLDFKP